MTQREKGIHDLESRAAPIIARAPLPIVEVQGKSHCVCYVNSAFCRLLGKTREELVGKCFADIVHKGDECVPVLDKVYQTGQSITLAHEDDTEATPASWVFAMWPALDAKEQPVGVIIQLMKTSGFHENVTALNEQLMISAVRQHELTENAEKLNEQLREEMAERKRAQAAKFLLASIVEGSDDSIVSIDFNQTITSWNQGAERLYGYSAKEAIGRSIEMLALPADFKKAIGRMDRIKRGEKVETFEMERVMKKGGHLCVSVTLSVIRDDSGNPVGVSTVSRDITEQKRLENELRNAKNQLEHRAEHLEQLVAERTKKLTQSIQSLEDLNYTMAHDLRAPIRAMKAFSVALVEDVPLDETGKQYAERITTAAERMDQLVNDLLRYGQLTHLDFPIQSVHLANVIQTVLRQLGKELEAARADVQVAETMPNVSGNETLLQQIFSNLLLNSVKFVAPGIAPKIVVGANVHGKTVRLWVEDNGIGIAPEHQDKIFGVFQRLHPVEDFPGTGVGLAVVKRAAERMGGTVGVESEPGKRSRFWVELPAGS